MAILTVCINNLGNLAKQNNICDTKGMRKKLVYTSLKNNKPANENYKHKKRNVIEKYITKIMKQCILDFCHSNKALQIDSNLHQIADVVLPNGKKRY